ncbi:MAG TPA: cytochrome P450 [Acidimicrobiales bacterium]|nr:cytochrome P450 [Acidimicrobiales bacterium]
MTGPFVIDLRDADYWRDPYPTLHEARERGRTAETQTGELVLLRADDIEMAHADPRFVTMGVEALERIGICDGPFYEWRALTLAVQNGDDHTRLRSLVGRAFTPRKVDRIRPLVREHAHRILDRVLGLGEIDAVKDFSFDLPLWAACRFLGLEDDVRAEVDAFLTGTEEGFVDPMTPERRVRAERSIVALYELVEPLVALRRRAPADDMITALLDGQRDANVSDAELLALVVNIIGGAVGSTRAALNNTVLLLARHPEQFALVRRDPDLVRPAVEESLRYHPPFRVGRRKTVAAVEEFGTRLELGATVFIARQSANRDPDRFEDPNRFDICRPERRHLTFSYGPHFCLGQALARVDLQEAVRALAERCSSIELLAEPDRVPFVMDEQLTALRVRLVPA